MALTPLDDLAIAGVGVLAGAVNTIAGAGSLITFPVLVALGLSPLSANVTNDIGIIPGNLSGVWGLRSQLQGQRQRAIELGAVAAVGSLAGGVLLLALPSHSFTLAVPALVAIASLLTLFQPTVAERVKQAGAHESKLALGVAVTLVALYGGYFGPGIGVLFIAALGIFIADSLPRLNAVKNILSAIANGGAGILFAFVAPVRWWVVLILAVSSTVGGPLGARLSLIIPPRILRPVIGILGLVAAGYLAAKAYGLT